MTPVKERKDANPSVEELLARLCVLSQKAFVVYVVMLRARKASHEVELTHKEIAHQYGVLTRQAPPSVETVGRALKELRSSGHLIHRRETQTASVFLVVPPHRAKPPTESELEEPGQFVTPGASTSHKIGYVKQRVSADLHQAVGSA